ncbi:MAG: mandelate racemase/muconate lactonizing enzyme family protein [Ilumatobacteraceae bacterium]
MRIARVTCFRQLQPFADGPYVLSGGRVDVGFDSLVVRLVTDGGVEGWGEMSPLGAMYDPAFADGAFAAAPLLADALLGSPVASVARTLDVTLKGHPYAKSAFDMAAWDALGRAAGLPLHDLLGGADGDGTTLYRSIGRADAAAMGAKAAEYRRRGYRRLQVKVGGDPMDDAANLRAVVAAVPDAELYCDANGGWQIGDARRFLAATADVAYVFEQPCATARECALLRPHAARPMVLDESITTIADAAQAAAGGIDGITIKIARVGGVTAARQIRDLAVGLGMAVTVEDTGGADIDTAAMAHLSISTPAALRAHTVDFHHWVTVSNGSGIPPTDGGLLRPPSGAGLGITVNVAALGAPVLDEGS